MRVAEISSFGSPEVLKEAMRPDLSIPSPGSGEILIKVTAAGINRPDVLQRLGKYAPPPGSTDIPGLEVAGEIVGGDLDHPDNSIRRFSIGQKVCALVAGGGYAEYCPAPIIQALPIPNGFSDIEAAGIPETFFTVWSNLFDRVKLTVASQPDHRKQKVLIHGGSSGIGVTAIQLVTAMGHEAIVTVGNEEKATACLSLGAVHAINYKTTDFVEAVTTFTGGKGVDVILDMVGGNYIPRDLLCLAEDGRIAVIAVQGGEYAEKVNVALLLRKRLTITGSTLRPRPIAFKGAIATALYQHVWPLFENKTIQPVIYKTFPLSEAAQAHALMESNEHIGKIILTI